MTAIRIVCSFDAAGTAEALMRLLAAEQHDVSLSKGRQSLGDLAAARTSREAVVLIWSQDAQGMHYMHEWAAAIEAGRLIEIARAGSGPRASRRAPAIDFSQWRGERGGKAWNALADRLRQVFAQWEPPKPLSVRTAAAAIGAGALAALSGVVIMGATEPQTAPKTDPSYDDSARLFAGLPDAAAGGMGGVINAVEPGAVDTFVLQAPRLQMHPAAHDPLDERTPDPLLRNDAPPPRERSLIERLAELNPLTRED
jgi:hypothetical protein